MNNENIEQDEIEVSTKKKKKFTQIENSIIRNPLISDKDFRILMILESYCWSGKWRVSIGTISKNSGSSKSAITDSLKWLAQNGYIEIIIRRKEDGKQRQVNEYVIQEVDINSGLPLGRASIEKRKARLQKTKKVEENSENLQRKLQPSETDLQRKLQSSNSEENPVDNSENLQCNLRDRVVANCIVDGTELRDRVVANCVRNNTIPSEDEVLNTIGIEEQKTPPIPEPKVKVLNNKELWNNILTTIKAELTETPFKTWIQSISFKDYKNNVVILEVANDFSKGIINSRYKTIIEKAFRAVTNTVPEIEINVKESA